LEVPSGLARRKTPAARYGNYGNTPTEQPPPYLVRLVRWNGLTSFPALASVFSFTLVLVLLLVLVLVLRVGVGVEASLIS
jgi:hypothetical protein